MKTEFSDTIFLLPCATTSHGLIYNLSQRWRWKDLHTGWHVSMLGLWQ